MKESLKILVIDKNLETENFLNKTMKDYISVMETALCIEEGIEKIPLLVPDLIFLSLGFPDENFQKIINRIKILNPYSVIFLLLDTDKNIPQAIEAMKWGAYDYILKPFPYERLKIIINQAIEKKDLHHEVGLLKSKLEKKFSFNRIIGNSNIIKGIFELIKKIADHNISVLITGESGTGKELIARVIHFESNRSNRSYVPIDCSTLPETLVESEIFGFEKGSFTGADKMNIGKIELAQGGTIFLDEIGNLSHNIQIKLLRLLQEREIERIGGRKRIKIDARFVTATNVDLKKSISEGKFREDLFFRLNEFSLHIPPLRERKEDIPVLMKHFLDEFNLEFHKEVIDFTPKAHEIFLNYSWFGNVRELKNVIKRAVLLAEESIDIGHLPLEIISQSYKASKLQQKPTSLKEISRAQTEIIERNLILAKLNETHWNKRKTATMLDVDYKTLFNKMKRYNIN